MNSPENHYIGRSRATRDRINSEQGSDQRRM